MVMHGIKDLHDPKIKDSRQDSTDTDMKLCKTTQQKAKMTCAMSPLSGARSEKQWWNNLLKQASSSINQLSVTLTKKGIRNA